MSRLKMTEMFQRKKKQTPATIVSSLQMNCSDLAPGDSGYIE